MRGWNNTGKTLVINFDRTCCEFSGRLARKLNAVLEHKPFPQSPASATLSAAGFSTEWFTTRIKKTDADERLSGFAMMQCFDNYGRKTGR